jgi:uncharacterized DUF497 family protein
MLFDWDEHNIAHIARHDISKSEVEEALLQLYPQVRNGEARLVQLGETIAGKLLLLVTTVRSGKIRVVTAMPAKRKYREWYFNRKEQRNGGEASTS